MPSVILPSLLSQRAGPSGSLEVDGRTAGDVLRTLEERYPSLKGWVLDDQGRVREHVKLFVNDTEASLGTRVSHADELHIVPAISGG